MMEFLPAVGIYVGQGASHSWTWLADICDREQYDNILFIDEQDIAAGALDRVSVFFISGGDTFAIAQALGQAGAEAIETFVRHGGMYVGACAGAYLPLKSSLPPLNRFNFVAARIANLTRDLPEAVARPEKFCTEYGCRYVYHPVREGVRLRRNGNGGPILAPLYGGPALLPSENVDVLAEYEDFTDTTEYLIDRELAAKSLLGTAAVIKKEYGRGTFYLFGPHFEHPDYPEANRLLFEIFKTAPPPNETVHEPAADDPVGRQKYREFMSSVSSARIMALALERSAFSWTIGRKVYDPEKIRVFLEAVWKRCRLLDTPACHDRMGRDEIGRLTDAAKEIAELIQKLRNGQQPAPEETACAERLFQLLRAAAAAFLTIYFRDSFTVVRRTSKGGRHVR